MDYILAWMPVALFVVSASGVVIFLFWERHNVRKLEEELHSLRRQFHDN